MSEDPELRALLLADRELLREAILEVRSELVGAGPASPVQLASDGDQSEAGASFSGGKLKANIKLDKFGMALLLMFILQVLYAGFIYWYTNYHVNRKLGKTEEQYPEFLRFTHSFIYYQHMSDYYEGEKLKEKMQKEKELEEKVKAQADKPKTGIMGLLSKGKSGQDGLLKMKKTIQAQTEAKFEQIKNLELKTRLRKKIFKMQPSEDFDQHQIEKINNLLHPFLTN